MFTLLRADEAFSLMHVFVILFNT